MGSAAEAPQGQARAQAPSANPAAARAAERTLASTGQAYDLLSGRYNELMWQNPVLAHSARVSEDLVIAHMPSAARLLEVGCGTGRETLKLAAKAGSIVACDVSKSSLEVLKGRASELGLSDRIEVRNIPASKVQTLEAEFGTHGFDGAFSSFALHYEPDLGVIPEQIWRQLKPGAPFLCSIFNRACLMEILLLAPFLVPRRGLRRLEGEMKLPVDQLQVTVRSWRPSEVIRLFEPWFSIVQTWAIPAIVPPHYLHVLVTRSGGMQGAWEDLDRRLNAKWPFRVLGSHTAFLFHTKPWGP